MRVGGNYLYDVIYIKQKSEIFLTWCNNLKFCPKLLYYCSEKYLNNFCTNYPLSSGSFKRWRRASEWEREKTFSICWFTLNLRYNARDFSLWLTTCEKMRRKFFWQKNTLPQSSVAFGLLFTFIAVNLSTYHYTFLLLSTMMIIG